MEFGSSGGRLNVTESENTSLRLSSRQCFKEFQKLGSPFSCHIPCIAISPDYMELNTTQDVVHIFINTFFS